MGDVEECRPPAGVELDGQALSAIGKLAQLALAFRGCLESMRSVVEREKLEEAIAMTDEVVEMLEAFDITFERLERHAETIVEVLKEGEEAVFCNQGSDRYYIRGVMARRVRTIVIGLVGFDDEVPRSYANLNLRENIVLLRGNAKNHAVRRDILVNVAC